MLQEAIDRLVFIVKVAPDLLLEISEENMSKKALPDKWSKKEILGHLIDSATNNHQRFIRAQFESKPEISYDQNKWNEFSFYQEIERTQIILFWTIYNRQLLEIIKRIPEERLMNQVKVGEKLLRLEYLIVDYVEHLEHHLKQVITY
jgi:hypothetical protein